MVTNPAVAGTNLQSSKGEEALNFYINLANHNYINEIAGVSDHCYIDDAIL